MNLMYELDRTILKMNLPTKNELFRSRLLKVRALQTENITMPHTWAVEISHQVTG